jgi:hypothetical protein
VTRAAPFYYSGKLPQRNRAAPPVDLRSLTLKFGAFTIGGIGTATFGAIILYQILASPME